MSHATRATYSFDAALMAVHTPRNAPRWNLSKFDQIVEKIEVFGLVGGDDELVCQWEKAIDSTPDKWLAQEGNRRLAASHTPGFATRLQNDGQVTAFAHEPSAHLDARQATSGHVRIM